MVRLKKAFDEVAQRLRRECRRHYGRRLVSLVLFGSAARGTQRADSDLDVLIVAEDLPGGRMRRVGEFEAVERALEPLLRRLATEGFRIALSPVFKTPAEAIAGSPLFLDMVEDAVMLHDRGRFFAGVLARLRGRLQELGARRVVRGNAWYWDLKPDFRPGEVFEL